jgi:hypothetical protein
LKNETRPGDQFSVLPLGFFEFIFFKFS